MATSNNDAHERARPSDSEPAPLGKDEWVGVQAWEVPAVRLARADRDPGGGDEARGAVDRHVHLQTGLEHAPAVARHRPQHAPEPPRRAECGDPRDCFRAPEELREAYAEMPELMARAEELLAGCSMALPEPPEGRLHNNPHTYTESEDEDEALVRALCAEGLAYRYPDHDDAVLERMEHEIGLIRKQGFLAYFLINWDITSYARSKGYFHVGRGSGANSLVAYLLRITDVDPIELDLYFERFLNLYRANPPDFDIDFSWTDRDDVVAYMFQRFPNVALLAAYNTFQYRAAVRELGKVMGLPKHEIDALCAGKFDPNRLGEMEAVVLKYAAVIRDFPSSLTLHACGVLIAHDTIHRYGALFMPPKGLPTVMFDMVVAEDVGLHKFDILSQRGLGKIKDAMDMVRARDPETAAEIDIHDMRRFKADEGVRAMLREARATGCFYVESPAMRMLMRKLQVDDYLGLVAASSVIRPGVSRSGMMRAYIERHRDPARRADAHPVLMHLMPETYGVMVYQEDVIKVAHRFAGLDLGEADVLRRGMSGKFRSRAEFDRARDAFHTKAVAKGHAPDLVREVWRQMESFAGYAFAKGHSASYAVESYQSLFLKVHFPLEYMCACINNFGGFYRTEFYVHEARMLGARIEAPCVNTVGALAVADPHAQTLTLGFNLVKDLNDATIEAMERARAEGGPFTSLVDVVERVAPSLEQLTILIRVGRPSVHRRHQARAPVGGPLPARRRSPRQSQQRTRDRLPRPKACLARPNGGRHRRTVRPSQTTHLRPATARRRAADGRLRRMGTAGLSTLLALFVADRRRQSRRPQRRARPRPPRPHRRRRHRRRVPGDRQRDRDRQGRADVLRLLRRPRRRLARHRALPRRRARIPVPGPGGVRGSRHRFRILWVPQRRCPAHGATRHPARPPLRRERRHALGD